MQDCPISLIKNIKQIFIASHNPDMISALRYISEKKWFSQMLTFIYHLKLKKKYKYDFTYLKNEMEPIF